MKRNGGRPTDIRKVQVVYDLAEQGLRVNEIYKQTGFFYKSIQRWLAHPERFDPYIDEVAVSRAIAGDGEVLDNLTIFEAEIVVQYFAKHRARMSRAEMRDHGIEMVKAFGEQRWDSLSKATDRANVRRAA